MDKKKIITTACVGLLVMAIAFIFIAVKSNPVATNEKVNVNSYTTVEEAVENINNSVSVNKDDDVYVSLDDAVEAVPINKKSQKLNVSKGDFND